MSAAAASSRGSSSRSHMPAAKAAAAAETAAQWARERKGSVGAATPHTGAVLPDETVSPAARKLERRVLEHDPAVVRQTEVDELHVRALRVRG